MGAHQKPTHASPGKDAFLIKDSLKRNNCNTTVMAITSAISDFVASIFVSGIFTLVADMLSGVVDIAGGIGKFVFGNIVVIVLVGAGVFAYMRYTAQGQRLATGNKTN